MSTTCLGWWRHSPVTASRRRCRCSSDPTSRTRGARRCTWCSRAQADYLKRLLELSLGRPVEPDEIEAVFLFETRLARASMTLVQQRDPNAQCHPHTAATLAALAPRQSQIVELRFFGGLTEDEIAEVLHISPRTVRNDWRVARAWLHRELLKG